MEEQQSHGGLVDAQGSAAHDEGCDHAFHDALHGNVVGHMEHEAAEGLGAVGETAYEKAPQRVILANGGEHFPEEGGLDDDVHRHVVLVRPVDGMDGPLVHHEDFSGPQGDLLLVVDKVMGFAGDHVHHFDVVMAMPGKRREPRVRPQKDHLARGHDLSAVDAEVSPCPSYNPPVGRSPPEAAAPPPAKAPSISPKSRHA